MESISISSISKGIEWHHFQFNVLLICGGEGSHIEDLNWFFLQGAHPQRRIYKLVLTGGPCGGKTTGQVSIVWLLNSSISKTIYVPEIKQNWNENQFFVPTLQL